MPQGFWNKINFKHFLLNNSHTPEIFPDLGKLYWMVYWICMERRRRRDLEFYKHYPDLVQHVLWAGKSKIKALSFHCS